MTDKELTFLSWPKNTVLFKVYQTKKNNAQEAALGVLFDPLAAKAAHEKGLGKTIEIGFK